MSLRHCEIFGSGINADIGCGTQLNWENNLFRDVCFTEVSGSGQFVIRNNSFVAPLGAEEYFAAFWSGTGWTITDNAFDGYWDRSSAGRHHNAYLNGATTENGLQTVTWS